METFRVGEAALVRPGMEVGSWRVVSWRGQGSYGVVYLAESERPEGRRRGALKLALHPGDERFEREVELLSRLNHPHVPRLLDSGTWTLRIPSHRDRLFRTIVITYSEASRSLVPTA